MSTPAREALDHGAIPWLFAAALVTTAPHFGHLPIWLSVSFGLLFCWAAWMWWRNRRLPGRWLLAAGVIAVTAGVHLEYRSLLGRDTGVAMLVMFMAMKLLELKRRRDGAVVINLGYFLLLTHYFYSQSLLTGLWLLIALWIVTAALIRLHGGRPEAARTTLRHAALLGAQALPFMLVLYLLFPRISGPLWGLPQDAYAGMTGLSESMSVGSLSELARNSEIAFRVRFDNEPPPRNKLYWRGPVLETFDGKTWRASPGHGQTEKLVFVSPAISYETTLEAHGQQWLLALDAVHDRPPEATLSGRLTVLGKEMQTSRQRYRFSSSLDYRFNVEENSAVLSENLRLPAAWNPRTRALAEQWKQTETSPEAIIDKALSLFSSEFYYTLRPTPLGPHSIDDFLFSTRRGFCEHFSAAFVTLMRNADIPARVVTGYQGGELNPLDGHLVVRQYDAHAWAEVWIENRGWIRVDPTAAVSPSRIERGIGSALDAGEPLPAMVQLHAEWLRTLRHRWEALNNAWNQKILGYDSQQQRDLLARLGLPDTDWRGLITTLGIALCLLLGTIVAWTLYQKPRQEPAVRLWHKALRHLARQRVNFATWETPLTIAEQVRRYRPSSADAFDRVVAAYLRTRYGTANDLKTLREAVARLP